MKGDGVLRRQQADADRKTDDARAERGPGVEYDSFQILALAHGGGGEPKEVTDRATEYKKWLGDN